MRSDSRWALRKLIALHLMSTNRSFTVDSHDRRQSELICRDLPKSLLRVVIRLSEPGVAVQRPPSPKTGLHRVSARLSGESRLAHLSIHRRWAKQLRSHKWRTLQRRRRRASLRHLSESPRQRGGRRSWHRKPNTHGDSLRLVRSLRCNMNIEPRHTRVW